MTTTRLDLTVLEAVLVTMTPGTLAMHNLDATKVVTVDGYRTIANTFREVDAASIVALCNAAPALIARIRALETAIGKLDAAEVRALRAEAECTRLRAANADDVRVAWNSRDAALALLAAAEAARDRAVEALGTAGAELAVLRSNAEDHAAQIAGVNEAFREEQWRRNAAVEALGRHTMGEEERAAFVAHWSEEMIAYQRPGGRWANQSRGDFIRALLSDLPARGLPPAPVAEEFHCTGCHGSFRSVDNHPIVACPSCVGEWPLAAPPLTVGAALNDPRVRAGTHWLASIEPLRVQWRIDNLNLMWRMTDTDDTWCDWRREWASFDALDCPCTIIPAVAP